MEFIVAWLRSSIPALLLSPCIMVCFAAVATLLWNLVNSRLPVEIRSKMTSLEVPGKYFVVIVVLGALTWGSFHISVPEEESSKTRKAVDGNVSPREEPRSLLERCIQGEIPDEFLAKDRKTLRFLRFEQEEAEMDLVTRHAKWTRRDSFLLSEREAPQMDLLERILEQENERKALWNHAAEEWKAACGMAASHRDPASNPSSGPVKP